MPPEPTLHQLHLGERLVPLRDGSTVVVRPISRDDAALLAAAYERLGDESRRRRFLAAPAHLSDEDLRYLTDGDGSRHVALIALDTAGALVGEARYVRDPDRTDTAEVAAMVVDEWQGRGIGRLLLEQLMAHAREQGLRRFTAIVSPDNRAVLDALTRNGARRVGVADGLVELEFEFAPDGLPERLLAALKWAAQGQLRLLGSIAARRPGQTPRA